MDTLIENDALEINLPLTESDAEVYYNGPSHNTGVVGPYNVPVKVRVRGYTTHVGNGNNSAAMRLLYNGEGFGEASDRNFNRSNLQVINHMVLDPGERAVFAIQSTNTAADQKYYGMEFWLSRA